MKKALDEIARALESARREGEKYFADAAVYVATGSGEEFAEAIDGLPDEMTGPTLLATTGPHCDRCSVRALCPVQPEGEMIHNA
mgnify:CR=1 FL=1